MSRNLNNISTNDYINNDNNNDVILPLYPFNNSILSSDASSNLSWVNRNEAPGNFTINSSATTIDIQNYKALFSKKYNNRYSAMTMGDDFVFLTNLENNTNLNGLTMFTRDNLASVRTGLLTISDDMRFQASNQRFFYLKQPSNQSIDLSLMLPNIAPSVGQVLTCNSVSSGDAILNWTTPVQSITNTDINVNNITANGKVIIPASTSGNYGFVTSRNGVECGFEIENFSYSGIGQAIANFQVNCGKNFNKNDTYQGGLFRIDTRTGVNQFEWLWKYGGSSSESRLMNLNNSNELSLGNTSTYNGKFIINKRNTIQDAIVINSNASDNDYMRILYQSNRYAGFSTRDNAKWECGVAQASTQSNLDRWYVGRSGVSGNDLVVNKDGNVGVGVSDPSALFFVKNGSFVVNSNGNVGLGIGSSPSYQLHLSSDFAAKASTSTWTTTSDERVKKNIVDADLDICYNNIKNLKLKYFEWDENYITQEQTKDRHTLGFIAQDVKTQWPKAVDILPEMKFLKLKGETEAENVYETIENFHTLNVDQINKSLIGCVKNLINKVETLEANLKLAENEITLLKQN